MFAYFLLINIYLLNSNIRKMWKCIYHCCSSIQGYGVYIFIMKCIYNKVKTRMYINKWKKVALVRQTNFLSTNYFIHGMRKYNVQCLTICVYYENCTIYCPMDLYLAWTIILLLLTAQRFHIIAHPNVKRFILYTNYGHLLMQLYWFIHLIILPYFPTALFIF